MPQDRDVPVAKPVAEVAGGAEVGAGGARGAVDEPGVPVWTVLVGGAAFDGADVDVLEGGDGGAGNGEGEDGGGGETHGGCFDGGLGVWGCGVELVDC